MQIEAEPIFGSQFSFSDIGNLKKVKGRIQSTHDGHDSKIEFISRERVLDSNGKLLLPLACEFGC